MTATKKYKTIPRLIALSIVLFGIGGLFFLVLGIAHMVSSFVVGTLVSGIVGIFLLCVALSGLFFKRGGGATFLSFYSLVFVGGYLYYQRFVPLMFVYDGTTIPRQAWYLYLPWVAAIGLVACGRLLWLGIVHFYGCIYAYTEPGYMQQYLAHIQSCRRTFAWGIALLLVGGRGGVQLIYGFLWMMMLEEGNLFLTFAALGQQVLPSIGSILMQLLLGAIMIGGWFVILLQFYRYRLVCTGRFEVHPFMWNKHFVHGYSSMRFVSIALVLGMLLVGPLGRSVDIQSMYSIVFAYHLIDSVVEDTALHATTSSLDDTDQEQTHYCVVLHDRRDAQMRHMVAVIDSFDELSHQEIVSLTRDTPSLLWSTEIYEDAHRYAERLVRVGAAASVATACTLDSLAE